MNKLIDKGCKAIDNLGAKLYTRNDDLSPEILEYELANAEQAAGLNQHGLLFSGEKNIHQLIEAREHGSSGHSGFRQAENNQAGQWLREYEYRKDRQNHRERRKKLEDIIRLLLPSKANENTNNERVTLLAKTYLYRSMLFRPKGYTAPDRKIEALLEARQLAENVLKKEINNAEALKILVQSKLELERLEELIFGKNDLEIFKKAAENIKKPESVNDLAILLKYAQLEEKYGNLNDISCIKKILNLSHHNYDVYLFKARAKFIAKLNPAEVKSEVREAINCAPHAFSNPFWEDLVSFLQELKKVTLKGNNQWIIWETLAVASWDKCREKEQRIGNNVILHWHWNQRKALYDLAFSAANTPKEKVKIADSVKSRPVMRYNALHSLRKQKVLKDSIVKNILDTEDEARDRRYIKNMEFQDHEILIAEESKENNCDYNTIADNWTAVHFYLNEIETDEATEQSGHAIFFQKDDSWICSFNYCRLYQAFLYWQDIESGNTTESAADAMLALCREIGETMFFLFTDKRLEGKSILFIPHGFLHRVPLHAAIEKETKNIFLKNHDVRYIPAWHLIDFKEKSDSVENMENQEKKRHFFYYPRPTDNDNPFSGKWVINYTDLKPLLMDYPSILMIQCNGKYDTLNPFKSSLESGISVLDLLILETELKETRVFLGTCHSDMTPLADHAVDEHLSLSSVFLTREAKESVAALWYVYPPDVNVCYNELLDQIETDNCSDALPKALRKWQSEELDDDPFSDITLFYYIIPFRVMGFPELVY